MLLDIKFCGERAAEKMRFSGIYKNKVNRTAGLKKVPRYIEV
jgi:hypothetical protein